MYNYLQQLGTSIYSITLLPALSQGYSLTTACCANLSLGIRGQLKGSPLCLFHILYFVFIYCMRYIVEFCLLFPFGLLFDFYAVHCPESSWATLFVLKTNTQISYLFFLSPPPSPFSFLDSEGEVRGYPGRREAKS